MRELAQRSRVGQDSGWERTRKRHERTCHSEETHIEADGHHHQTMISQKTTQDDRGQYSHRICLNQETPQTDNHRNETKIDTPHHSHNVPPGDTQHQEQQKGNVTTERDPNACQGF